METREKSVLCMNRDGVVMEFTSASLASKMLGIPVSGIRDCLRGAVVTTNGYSFIYGTRAEYDEGIIRFPKKKEPSKQRTPVLVVVFRPDTTVYGYYSSIRSAARAIGVSSSALTSCVKGINNVAGGYIIQPCSKNAFKKRIAKYKIPEKHGKNFPVVQVTCEGEKVAVFDNVNKAAESSPNFERTGISKCANHKLKTAYGFKWYFLDEWVLSCKGEQ